MQDIKDMINKLIDTKASSDDIGENNAVEDDSIFTDLRKLKDERRKRILESQKNNVGMLDMMAEKEKARDFVEGDMTQEEKEDAAAANLEKKRKEQGLD